MLVKTLATIVKKKLAKKFVFPKSYKTFRKKNSEIDFFRLLSELFIPNISFEKRIFYMCNMCFSTKLDVLSLNLQKKNRKIGNFAKKFQKVEIYFSTFGAIFFRQITIPWVFLPQLVLKRCC
jgi:hypothetical protein